MEEMKKKIEDYVGIHVTLEVSANAITKRATKHYTVVINTKNNQ